MFNSSSTGSINVILKANFNPMRRHSGRIAMRRKVFLGLFWAWALWMPADTRIRAQGLDPYGGYTGLTGNNTSGFFRVEQIGDRYWLVTPQNHVFISLAFDTANFYDGWGGYCPPIDAYPNPHSNRAKYNNSNAAWEAAVKANMSRWGFNSLGGWCQKIPGVSESVAVLFTMNRAEGLGINNVAMGFRDVFDPRFEQAADDVARQLAAHANDPYRIGAFPDNELHWSGADPWGNNGGKPTFPDTFISCAASYHCKQFWAGTFLPGKYADIADLNAAYGTSFTSFTGPEPTSLINVTDLPTDPAHPSIFEDKKDFVEAVADRYYSVCTSAMRRHDPNHLVFSARWALWTVAYDVNFPENEAYNERIWKKIGQYCDIVAINSYQDNLALETWHQLFSRVFAASGKPFMVTEWATWANDTQFVYLSWYRDWQRDRGEFYFDQMKQYLGFAFDPPGGGDPVHPCLGSQWFQYNDEPSLGRMDLERNNFGLFNVKDEGYQTALDVMNSLNRQVYTHAAGGQPAQLLAAPVAKLPMAEASTSSVPTFSWTPVAGAAGYTLLLSPEKCFPDTQAIRIEQIATAGYTPDTPLAAGLWHWCVAAISPDGLSGKFSTPAAFRVASPTSDRPASAFLGMEDVSGWLNVALDDAGYDGTVWAFADRGYKTAGNSSARVVFTMNSLNKQTGVVNAETGRIVWRYTGGPLRVPRASQLSFDVRPARATDRLGTLGVASRFLRLRVVDEQETVLADAPIDAAGALAAETWSTVTIPLAEPHASHLTRMELYVDMADAALKIPWDQRLIVWVDNMTFSPLNSRADLDADFDVDQEDFAALQICLSGFGIPQPDIHCRDARLDGDSDVDESDVAAFLQCMSGPNVLADPNCPG